MGLFNWFKAKGEEGEAAGKPTATPPLPPAPARVLKTVSPNTMKPLNLREGAQRIASQLGPAVAGGFDLSTTQVATAEAQTPATTDQPERDIYLEIGDFVDRIPREYLGNYQPHLNRRIAFRLGDIFADLAKGRATIPLQTLYHFCPEIFSRPCTEAEPIPISLPLQKLVEQVGSFEGRSDQIMPEQYAQIDTPIARVAAEDGGAPIPVAPRGGSSAPPPPPPIPQMPAASQGTRVSAPLPVVPPPPVFPTIAPPTMAPLPPLQPIQPPAIPLPAQSHLTRPPAPPTPPVPAIPAGSHVRPSTQLAVPSITSVSAPGTPGRPGAPGSGKRPPATVRASFAGGKITLRASVPPQPSSGPMPSLIPGLSPAEEEEEAPKLSVPIPSRVSQPNPATAPPMPSAKQQKKITGRIQIPPLRLQGDVGSRPALVSQPGGLGAIPSAAPSAPPPIPLPASAPPRILPAATVAPPPRPPATIPAPAPFAPATPVAPAAGGSPQLAFAAPQRPSPAATAVGAISLSLSEILQALPPNVFGDLPPSVPADARVSLPFELIEPQLSEGKVQIPAQMLLDSVRQDLRPLLAGIDPTASLPLPLPEIFKNLPENTLSMRRDQVMENLTEEYETPFSVKMKEDEERFGQGKVTAPMPPVRPQAAAPAQAVPQQPKPTIVLPTEEEISEVGKLRPAASVPVPRAVPVAKPAAPQPAPVEATRVSRPQPVPPSPPTPAPRADEPSKTQKFAVDELVREPGSPRAPLAHPAPQPVAKAVEQHPKLVAEAKPPIEAKPAVTAKPTAPARPLVEAKPLVEARPMVEAKSAVEARPVVEARPLVEAKPVVQAQRPEKPQAIAPSARVGRTPVISPRIATSKPPAEDEYDISELQALFMTEEHLDAKNIVKHTSRLPGLTGCLLMFADGLPIAGNLPENFNQDAFGAIIPRFFGKVTEYARDLRLGMIETVTLHTDRGPVSLFMHDTVCMALLHSKSRFLPGVREKLAVVVREVSRMYGGPPRH